MSENQPTQAPDQGAGAQAPAETTRNLFMETGFRLIARDPQTGQTSSPQFSMKSRCFRVAADVSRDASGQWVSMLLPRLKYPEFFDGLIRASKEPGPWKESYHRNEERDGVTTGITITAGVDADGVVYWSISNNQGGEKRFDMVDDNYINIMDMNGNPIGKSEASRRFAKRWATGMHKAADSIWETGKDTDGGPARRQQNQGGNFRGGNQGGGFRQGGQGNNFRQGGQGGGFKPKWQGNQNQGGFKPKWQGNQNQGNFKPKWQGNQNQGGYQQQQEPQAPTADYNFEDYNIGG